MFVYVSWSWENKYNPSLYAFYFFYTKTTGSATYVWWNLNSKHRFLTLFFMWSLNNILPLTVFARLCKVSWVFYFIILH